MLARLALAALVGGIIGIERRHPDRPAGVRTLALTAIGAAAFTLVSIHGFGDESATRDPARVAAQVATGVGFIGAGTIIRYGSSVRGLTTATAIWLAASLGMAAGTGMYVCRWAARCWRRQCSSWRPTARARTWTTNTSSPCSARRDCALFRERYDSGGRARQRSAG